jgi:hypothetical protein
MYTSLTTQIKDDCLSETTIKNLLIDAKYHLKYGFLDQTTYSVKGFDTYDDDPNIFDVGQFTCTIKPTNFARSQNPNEEFRFNDYLAVLKPVLWQFEDIFNFDILEVERAKFNILTARPDTPEGSYNHPHIDTTGTGYVSLLLYLNDSDGDTVIFNEDYIDGQDRPEKLTIEQRISPKQNRAILFDSTRLHASCQPKETSARYIFNTVLKVRFRD